MYNSFISIVGVIYHPRELELLPEYLSNLFPVLSEHFSDFEVVLVNNNPEASVPPYIDPLPDELKHNIYLLNLSRTTNRNHAILAGLDRANGDYTVIFEFDFYQEPETIIRLFEKTQEHFDIVYLRAKGRRVGFRFQPLYKLFYYLLKHYSTLKIDEMAHNTRIISRRALNSLLRLRENLRYMKAIYSIVGYKTAFLETDKPLHPAIDESFAERFRTSLVAITSFTTFLRSLLLWIFIFSVVFLLGVIVNALKVKFTGIDLFGNMGEPFSGWTFLVILIAVFFATTCLNLYIMSIYLSNIYNEIKQRPSYIIESIQRF
ncbi:MAG: glycosyltransferase [Lewinellaceae bacterium]|nr:glycosyltransferase [Lewinellaceae bacterium]MCB9288404.1 glycosyltransferase [Lewinellaceae bacterium]